MKLANCRSCHASIIWAHTPQGKAIPIDARPVANGNLVLVEDGPISPVANLYIAPGDFEPKDRYVSHFVTCPQAKSHRKRA